MQDWHPIFLIIFNNPFLSMILCLGLVTVIFLMISQILSQRHARLRGAQHIRMIEAVAKLGQEAQLRLIETFPDFDINDPKSVKAALEARKEVRALEDHDA